MRRKGLLMVFVLVAGVVASLTAQNEYRFSLKEALSFAEKNSYQLINSQKDVEAAKQKIVEQTAAGLPQINGMVQYKDNIARPVFVLPGEFSGRPGQETKVQFGTRYTGTLSGSVNQLIFDGRYIVGLKTAKKFLEKVDKEFFKNKVAVKEQVSKSYYQVLAAEEAVRIIDTTLKVTRKLRDETRELYKTGFAEDVDVEQMDLLVSNLESSKTFTQNQVDIAKAFLKFYLGLKDTDKIVLTDDMPVLVLQKESENLIEKPFDVTENINFVTLEKQKEIAMLQVKLAKSAYLPSLSANLNLQTQAQLNEWKFFNPKTPWDFSGFLGVTMRIPVFSSWQRTAQLKQAKIAFSQMEVLEDQTKTQLNIQYQTLKNNYENALSVYKNKIRNRKVARKIYAKTSEKYIRGMASSLDLLNTHNQFLTAEKDYINATLGLLDAAEQLENILIKAK